VNWHIFNVPLSHVKVWKLIVVALFITTIYERVATCPKEVDRKSMPDRVRLVTSSFDTGDGSGQLSHRFLGHGGSRFPDEVKYMPA
jgi:hypothetical protein